MLKEEIAFSFSWNTYCFFQKQQFVNLICEFRNVQNDQRNINSFISYHQEEPNMAAKDIQSTKYHTSIDSTVEF